MQTHTHAHTHTHTHTHKHMHARMHACMQAHTLTNCKIAINKLLKSWYDTVLTLTQNVNSFSKLIV